MVLVRILACSVVGIFAALGALLVAGLAFAPGPLLDAQERDDLLVQFVHWKLSEPNQSPVYVGLDGHDPSSRQLQDFRDKHRGVDIRVISEAPPLIPASEGGRLLLGSREPYEFVKVSLMAMPLYRTAIVGVQVRACHYQLTTVRVFGRWRKVSNRWSCF
jgi:hypothetical protein